MKYFVSVYINMTDLVEVEVEADDAAEAMDLAYDCIKDRIELDEYYVDGIRPETYDPDDNIDEYAWLIPVEVAKKCFDYIMPFWPDFVDVSDKKLLPGNGLYSPSFNDIDCSIEDVLERKEETGAIPQKSKPFFGELSYCVSGALHSKAREEGTKLYPKDLTFDEFERYFVKKHEGWEPTN